MRLLTLVLFIVFSSAAFAQEVTEDFGPTTQIEFSEESYDFVEVVQGEIVSHVFKFTNTGTEPLLITSARGTCGCTIPFYPQVPIMPGEKSEIQVEFHSKGKLGLQTKRVYVVANTVPSTTSLEIKGQVLRPPEDETEPVKNNQQEADKAALQSLNSDCVALFPNPTSETLQLELKESIGKSAEIEIHTQAGKSVLKRRIERISHETTQFDVSDFPKGIYVISIHIETNNQFLSQCFVVN